MLRKHAALQKEKAQTATENGATATIHYSCKEHRSHSMARLC